jgi:hypothetical protein
LDGRAVKAPKLSAAQVDENYRNSIGWLSAISAVTGVLALVLVATGVGAPVAAVLGAVSLATGAIATAMDCGRFGMSVSCGVEIAATSMGLGGAAFRLAGPGLGMSVRNAERMGTLMDSRSVLVGGGFFTADSLSE